MARWLDGLMDCRLHGLGEPPSESARAVRASRLMVADVDSRSALTASIAGIYLVVTYCAASRDGVSPSLARTHPAARREGGREGKKRKEGKGRKAKNRRDKICSPRYTHTHTYTHIHTYMHTYIHTYTHTYIHTYPSYHIHMPYPYTQINQCTHQSMHTSIYLSTHR